MNTATVTVLHNRLPAAPSEAAAMQANLKAAEAAADEAAARAGALIGQAIAAAKTAGIHRLAIVKDLNRLAASITGALAVGHELQSFHQGTRRHMGKLDLVELGWGDTGDTPDFTGSTGA